MTGLRMTGASTSPISTARPATTSASTAGNGRRASVSTGWSRLWQFIGRSDLLGILEHWYARRIKAGSAAAQRQHHRADAGAQPDLGARRATPRWQPVLDEWADRVMTRFAAHRRKAAFQHDVSDRINDGELWDDTLFMVALFLASYGRQSGRQELVEEAARQFLVHARYLGRPRNRPVVPWLDLRRPAQFRPGALGARQCLDHRRHPRSHRTRRHRRRCEGFPRSACSTAQVETLLQAAGASRAHGTRCSTIRNPIEEISATAGFGYGLLKAARQGIGDKRWREAGLKALKAVLANIERQRRRRQRVLRHAHGPRSAILSRHPDPADRLWPGAGHPVPDRRAPAAGGDGAGRMTMKVLYGASPGDIGKLRTRRNCAPTSWSRTCSGTARSSSSTPMSTG